MPIYEYTCPACGTFEAIQKAGDAPLKRNPDCNRSDCPKKAVRQMSASALKFVGGGWYQSDYKPTNGPAAPSDAAESGDKKTETSTDTTKAVSKKGSGPCGSGCGCH